MDTLPEYISIIFLTTVFLAIVALYRCNPSKGALAVLILWTTLQVILALAGVYQNTTAMPPRLMLFGLLPCLVGIIILFTTNKGRHYMDELNLQRLTLLHAVRIPVEIVLALLFHHGVMSRYITFEGTNFDLFSGITAVIVALVAFKKGTTQTRLLFAWNMVCLLLLLNVVITAILSIPSPIQQLAFDQPNIAVLQFPFSLLPTVVVPIVLFAHLAAFRKLSRSKKQV